jgi:hypothetical protein
VKNLVKHLPSLKQFLWQASPSPLPIRHRFISSFTPKPLHLLLGVALALGGCSEGNYSPVQGVVFGEPDELSIQPIQVCDDRGNNCAGLNIFADITAKILEQAKLKVTFLPPNRLNASRFLSLNDSRDRGSSSYEFYELSRTGEPGAFGRHPVSTQNGGPVNVWFVDEIESTNGFTQYGLAWVNANGVVISSAVEGFGPNGRTDTVAHEIGHNLGLRHSTLGAGGANNLLTDGDRRNIPSSLADIGTTGGGLSQLTEAQIATIKQSAFANSGLPGSTPSTEVEAKDTQLADAQLLAEVGNVSYRTRLNAVSGTRLVADAAALKAADPALVPEPSALLGLSGLALLALTRRSLVARS